MKKIFIAMSILLIFNLYSDDFDVLNEFRKNEYFYGNTRIILDYKIDDKSDWPKYILYIINNDSLLGKHENIGFKELYASQSQKYFIGISDDRLTRYAFVIFNYQGNILKAVKFDNNCFLDCSGSMMIKNWYDIKNPQIELSELNDILSDVRIKSNFNSNKLGTNDNIKNDNISLLNLDCSSHKFDSDTIHYFSKYKIRLSEKYFDDYYPIYNTCIFKNDSLIHCFNNIGFENIYTSPNNNYFLCVSTSPEHKFKYAIFDKNGKIIKKEKFYSLINILEDYEYDFNNQIWYNIHNPNVEFIINNSQLEDVKINSIPVFKDDSKIKRISLLRK